MIPVQNIYYMLSYAFRILSEKNYRKMATEDFANTSELMVEILIMGMTQMVKSGLGCEYVEQSGELNTVRGKIDINESIKRQTMRNKRIVCTYDEFTVDNPKNRIIKSTALLLAKADISKDRKRRLKKLLVHFDGVGITDLKRANWNMQFNRNNQMYRMLISICYLVVKGLLQTQADGRAKLMDFMDDQRMYHLYEKFILEYYRQEYPCIKANASQIKWQLDDDSSDMLPSLMSDIMLEYKEKVLIIDAKYYSGSTQLRFGRETVRSGNLYQIFTYVKNKEAELSAVPHQVAGMLLYAGTDGAIQPDCRYSMSGNIISVKTLNLNCDFAEIKRQLDKIVVEYFEL